MSTILIAVDGTERDRTVIRQALDLLGEDHEYLVANVSDEPAVVAAASVSYASASVFSVPALSHFADGYDRDADEAEHIAEAAVTASGLDHAESIGEVGDPASILVEIARQRSAAAIVVGQSRRGWISRLLDPSVEAAVVERATCPVIVIHGD